MIDTINGLPVIIQGALGSALFWICLQIIIIVSRHLAVITDRYKKSAIKSKLMKEYIYRKFTSSSGLAYYPQGYLVSFYYALRYILYGFVFICFSFLLGGDSELIRGISLIGAIFIFTVSLSWITEQKDWISNNPLEHWKRIAELEIKLFDNVKEDTQNFIDKFKNKTNG